MSNVQRLHAINLLVQRFLQDRGVSAATVDEWLSEDVQQELLQHAVCLCVNVNRSREGQDTRTPSKLRLTFHSPFFSGPQTVSCSKELVYLGRNLTELEHLADAQLVQHPFTQDVGVYDLHLLLKRVSPDKYMISAFAPNSTWIQVGAQTPMSAPAEHDMPSVILLPGSAFRVGSHVLQVVHAPGLTAEQIECLPTASPVLPRPPCNDEHKDTVVERTCVVECVAPLSSPVHRKLWTLRYSYGNVEFSVGTHVGCTLTLPASAGADEAVHMHHCSIYASMGFFWLAAKDGPTFFHFYPTSACKYVKADRPVNMLLGLHTRVTVAVETK